MGTIKLFSETGRLRNSVDFFKLQVNTQRYLRTAVLAISFLSFNVQIQAQRFWLTTYEFPYGAKTGITLNKNNCLFVGLTNGVIQSCDEGNHFDLVLKTSAIFSVFSTKEGKVLAGGVGKIFITDVSGQNWDSISVNSSYPIIQFAEKSKGDLFAIASGYDNDKQIYTGDGVLISENKGLIWTQRNSGLGTYKSCEKITIDKNDRLYVASADDYNSGNGGLFISDDNGMLWKHIDVTIDGKNTINDHLKVGNAFGLSVSPKDSVYFSFSGISANVAVNINVSKSIYDIEKNNFWKTFTISNTNMWWNDKPLFTIHYAANGDWYSSCRGTINSGATYYSKTSGDSWMKVDYGLGLNIFGMRDAQFFAENPEGKIFMIQSLDERIYWTDASIPTSVRQTPEQLHTVALYPNPVNRGENLTIQSNWNESNYKINIYDGLGRQVAATIGTENLHNLKAPMNPGFYYLEVEGSQTRKSGRFVVR